MSSVVEVCNMALSHIRAGSINSLTEGSLQSQTCSLWYPKSRDRILADAPWQFAQSIKPLTMKSGVSVFGWAYIYQYPTDCLRIGRLVRNWSNVSATPGQSNVATRLDDPLSLHVNFNQPIDYRVMNVSGEKVIVCNEPDLRIDYTSKTEDPNLFDTDFTIALSHLLASNISIAIVGGELGRAFKSDNLSLYQSYISAALASNNNEQYHTPSDSEFITVRS